MAGTNKIAHSRKRQLELTSRLSSQFFYTLLGSNPRGVRLRMNIPETLILWGGMVRIWLSTVREGHISSNREMSVSKFEKRVTALAKRRSKWLVVERKAHPKALNEATFQRLCSRLEVASEREHSAEPSAAGERGLPFCVHSFVEPYLGQRYVAYMTFSGPEQEEAFDCSAARFEYSSSDGSRVDRAPDDKSARLTQDTWYTLRRLTSALRDYMEAAHDVRLTAIACEYVQDDAGIWWLHAVLQYSVEPASLSQISPTPELEAPPQHGTCCTIDAAVCLHDR